MHQTGRACRSLTAVALLLAAMGCSSSRPPESATTLGSTPSTTHVTTPATKPGGVSDIHPVLYHRRGGIAGTDDRVVIWTDGFVEVTGGLLTNTTARIPNDRLNHLISMFEGWDKLNDTYRASGIMDAYTITIYYAGKSVTVDDIAPDLPPQFRAIFTEIESIAAQATINETKLAP